MAVIQPNGPNDWTLDSYVDQAKLGPDAEHRLPGGRRGPGHARLGRQATTTTARRACRPASTTRSTIRATRSASSCCGWRATYKGRITTWVIWNEPDFLPGESGTWWTWSGNAADFYKLLKTAYRAIKEVDPARRWSSRRRRISPTPCTAASCSSRACSKEANKDPEAPANGYFFDAVGVNLYCSLDAVYKVYGVYASILAQYQLQKPLWLTETNCPVYNDATMPEPPSGASPPTSRRRI